MSQNSQTYRHNFVSPPTVANVHSSPQTAYYNQMNPYFGSQFPASQYMYQNFNNSKQMGNFDCSKQAIVQAQMQPQSPIFEDSQQANKFNSKLKKMPEVEATVNEIQQKKEEKAVQMMEIETPNTLGIDLATEKGVRK